MFSRERHKLPPAPPARNTGKFLDANDADRDQRVCKVALAAVRHNVAELLQRFREGAAEIDGVLQVLRELNARYPNRYLLNQKYLYPDTAEALLRFSGWAARSGVVGK